MGHEIWVHGPILPCDGYNDRKHPSTFKALLVFILPVQTFPQMSFPSSPTHFPAQNDHAVLRSSSLPRTRTVAIVKNHALPQRLDIEPRISEAGFEVRETAPRRRA